MTVTMTTKERREFVLTLEKTSKQTQIIIGSLLGDGYLFKSTRKGKDINGFKLDIKLDALEYLESIHKELGGCPQSPKDVNSWCRESIKVRMIPQKGKWKEKSLCSFRTFIHPSFWFYDDIFYKIDETTGRRKKIVPINLHKHLTPLVLAHWFIQDGSKGISGYMLHTQRFTFGENKRIQDALGKVFKFETSLYKDRKTKNGIQIYKVYIKASSKEHFIKIISPYIHPYFEYKL